MYAGEFTNYHLLLANINKGKRKRKQLTDSTELHTPMSYTSKNYKTTTRVQLSQIQGLHKQHTSYGAFLVLIASFSLKTGITLRANNEFTV